MPATKERTAFELGTMAIAEHQAARVGTCPSHYIHGSDKAGHNFAKELYCGAEWCPICGKKSSPPHKRRIASILPKLQQLDRLGYMVIEWPLATRDKLRSRKALSEAGKIITSVLNGSYEVKKRRKEGILTNSEAAELKARYFDKGIRRWHYFGDIEREISKLGITWQTDRPAGDTEPTVKTNIHCNVLTDSGFLVASWLRHIQYNLREALNEPNLIVHYGYTRNTRKMVHIAEYVTRATFLDIKWDKWLAGQLYGFRNMRSWGVWNAPAVWQFDDKVFSFNIQAVNSLGESRCYLDNLPITWSKPRPIRLLDREPVKEELGAGYYRLADTPHYLPIQEDPSARARRLVMLALAKNAERSRIAAITTRDDDLAALRMCKGHQGKLSLGSPKACYPWGRVAS